jgi:hypothetical protein
MGQAKARGSFEQRRALAIANAEAQAIEKQRLRDEKRRAELEVENALPRQQRERLKSKRFQTRALLAVALGFMAADRIKGDTP